MGSPIPGLFSILQHPKPTQPSSVFEETVFQLPNHKMAVSSYAYASLSLIGLCALAGAGVGVGSGIAMMSAAMMEEEAKAAAAPKTSAASVAEKKITVFRGFAASA